MLTSLYLAARSLVTDRKGVTAMEYGLIAALVAVVIIGTVTTLGTNLELVFAKIRDTLKV
ncbi:Flp family type IVb pilin [Paracraurococcus ruber]|uniref:Flp family type IVb pilin n=1 Tax=Paracraurococcus ruber TaxID=77675 RepID=A0ABS1D1R9_9PROT|nr:Flp family type IVb pilin [Paracraurococcus ruber]MBK1660773.1 Flp family type IVb pilin [Paracraurococcus ruber]TDG30499.1 Flp family type IVb pilin [Paracraurococcus ruber]